MVHDLARSFELWAKRMKVKRPVAHRKFPATRATAYPRGLIPFDLRRRFVLNSTENINTEKDARSR